MTPDQELIALRREVRELREELAEYERQARGRGVWSGDDAGQVAGRLWTARAAFRTPRGGAQGLAVKAILAMADRAPKVVPHQVFLGFANKDPYECSDRYVHVVICQARAALRPYGLKIETIWGGGGYRMSAADAAAVKRLIGELADD